MRISDWSSDVCSSDLWASPSAPCRPSSHWLGAICRAQLPERCQTVSAVAETAFAVSFFNAAFLIRVTPISATERRSEEHTSELQSLMRISYAVFCLKKKTNDRSVTISNQVSTSPTSGSMLYVDNSQRA